MMDCIVGTELSYYAPPLRALIGALDSGLLLPEVNWTFEPSAPRTGLLRWTMTGIQLPAIRRHSIPPSWSAFKTGLAGKFDVQLFTSAPDGTGARLAARLEALSPSGEINLSGLPPVGTEIGKGGSVCGGFRRRNQL